MSDRYVLQVKFPLSHVHRGLTLGNGQLGLSVWGEKNILKITVSSSELWDHRGGLSWSKRQNYPAIRKALETNNEPELRAMFAQDTLQQPHQPRRPTIFAPGRVELEFPADCELKRARLHLDHGVIAVTLNTPQGEQKCDITLSMSAKGVWAFTTPLQAQIRVIPAFELIPEMPQLAVKPPQKFTWGFFQTLPNDPGYTLGFRRNQNGATFSYRRTYQVVAPSEDLPDWEKVKNESVAYWQKFWTKVPEITCDNPYLNEFYPQGLFQFQAMTAPDGTPAGLQGPWIEDATYPPWQADYHFNINVQLCYSPAFGSGLAENYRPMFDLIWSWRDTMQMIARNFAGIEDGYMLPHAVDDRCTCMGAFWAGAIDHGCTAWMAQQMFEYYKFTHDREFLQNIAFEFMRGAMRVFEVMLEKTSDGQFRLPLSVSPEFNGSEMNAWGENSSFQLAAIHNLANNLLAAAQILGQEPKPIWQEIVDKLPQATLVGAPGEDSIGLWKNQPLSESHRHHSHLAGIAPFATIELDSPEWREVIDRTQKKWVSMGTGQWSGWSFPWASQLHNRFGHPDMAVWSLEIWSRIYRNASGRSFHDPLFPGFSQVVPEFRPYMQMDGQMGCVAAVHELYCYEYQGELQLLHGVPSQWRHISLRRLTVTCGLEMNYTREENQEVLSFTATKPVKVKLHLPPRVSAWRCQDQPVEEHLTCQLKAGETIEFRYQ